MQRSKTESKHFQSAHATILCTTVKPEGKFAAQQPKLVIKNTILNVLRRKFGFRLILTCLNDVNRMAKLTG
jgi:hypothetical protein